MFLTLALFWNIEQFKSKIILKAEGNNNYTLYLRENGNFKLRKWSGDHSDFYKGKYLLKTDTLKLFQNDDLKTKFVIDTIFIRKKDSLIPTNHSRIFVIIK